MPPSVTSFCKGCWAAHNGHNTDSNLFHMRRFVGLGSILYTDIIKNLTLAWSFHIPDHLIFCWIVEFQFVYAPCFNPTIFVNILSSSPLRISSCISQEKTYTGYPGWINPVTITSALRNFNRTTVNNTWKLTSVCLPDDKGLPENIQNICCQFDIRTIFRSGIILQKYLFRIKLPTKYD